MPFDISLLNKYLGAIITCLSGVILVPFRFELAISAFI